MTAALTAHVLGIGLIGPGLPDWPAGRAVLRGEIPYAAAACDPPMPAMLDGAERRRSSRTIRLALEAARQAAGPSGLPVESLPVVFGSAAGDTQILTRLLETLHDPQRPVSPTLFHNSVHNAPAGYWTIGGGCQQTYTSLAAHDATFGAVLLKGMIQLATEARPVLLACYDDAMPPPLLQVRPIPQPFAVALVLSPHPAASAIALRLGRDTGDGAADGRAGLSAPRLAALGRLWRDNPAARALPLLEALALGEPAAVVLERPGGGRLPVEVAPC